LDYSDPAQRYKKGMDFSEKTNFAYELEQEIVQNKKELAEIKRTCGDPGRIKELEDRISKREKLLQQVQEDIHGIEV
jgi:hypothetical protein